MTCDFKSISVIQGRCEFDSEGCEQRLKRFPQTAILEPATARSVGQRIKIYSLAISYLQINSFYLISLDR